MGLFDSRKERKTLVLAKKLQEEADKEWEREQNIRKEQELNDEAIAKALQAQLEEEEERGGATSPLSTPSLNSPPPLPLKPREYNNSFSNLNNRKSFSSVSLPMTTTPLSGLKKNSPPSTSSITPLYGLSLGDNEQKKPIKSYVSSSQTYRPELKFNIATPGPSHSSVFNESTPKITPNQVDIRHHTTSSTPILMKSTSNNDNHRRPQFQGHMSMPEPIDTIKKVPITSPPFTPHKSDPVILPSQQTSTPTPPAIIPSSQHYNNGYASNNNVYSPVTPQSSIYPPPIQTNNNNGFSGGYSSNQNNGIYPSNQLHNNSGVYPSSQNTRFSLHQNSVALPLSSNSIIQNATFTQESTKPPIASTASLPPAPFFNSNSSSSVPFMQNTPVSFLPSNTTIPYVKTTSAPVISPPFVQSNDRIATPLAQERKSTNPYENMKYSSSTLSLKPDEDTKHKEESDEDDWDVVKTMKPPTSIGKTSDEDSDDESVYDYSDMVTRKDSSRYVEEKEDSEEEDDWHDEAIDPFADNLSVQVPSTSNATSATIVGEPVEDLNNLLKSSSIDELPEKTAATALQPRVEILDPTLAALASIKDEKTAEEKQRDAIHQYEEKESDEIESVPTHPRQQSYLPTPQFQQANPFYPQPLIELDPPENEQLKVYPTNVVKAGAPPKMSKTNPYNKSTSTLKPVPATDYGYFKDGDNKRLPKLPPAISDGDRHITVASINPGQKVWIRVHPTDTGKSLAERIGIVASYRTRRVTKITSRQGRVIPLNTAPLFDDWEEILKFQEGELWRIEWEPIEHNSSYVDIITEGKEFMKHLKANFKNST